MSVELDKDAIELNEETGIREFVAFLVCDEIFAVDMAPVREIVRVPDIVKVPKAPPSLMGISNLRGEVLPIINLRRVFALQDRELDETSRVIVFDFGYILGFLVDRVLSVIGVEESKVEDASDVKSIIRSEYVSGVIKDVAGYDMVMVLDINKVLEMEFSGFEKKEKKESECLYKGDVSSKEEVEKLFDERQFVSFLVSGEEYAISIEDVQEIVQLPDSLVRVPRADSSIVGVMNLRNRVLPLASLRSIFGFPEELKESSRIVVLNVKGLSIGIVVDSVREVLRVPASLIEPIPWVLQGESTGITGICRLEEGKRLVSVISVSELFKSKAVKEALSSVEVQEEEVIEEEASEEEEQVVVFRLDDGEYAVPITCVQEIVRVPEELTIVPKAPEFVEGVINLRGVVLPVVDLRKRLGFKTIDRDERQRIVVLIIDKEPIGFIVDFVSEVLKIPKALIKEAPRVSPEQARLLKRIANLEEQGRLIQFIDVGELLMKEEIKELSSVGREVIEET